MLFIIHTYFTRMQPTSIVNDFTAEQSKDISLQLYSFLKAFQEMMEGILDNCVDNEYFLQNIILDL